MSKFYLSTAIAYTNAKPHLGHALEFVFADVIARYHRLKGDDTYFLTGTDEHGSKIYKTATEKGLEVKNFVDLNAEYFFDIVRRLNLSNDNFIRTSSELHKKGAEKIWNKLVEANDIYLNTYQGLYCNGCETFLPEKDLIDGKCAIHLKEPENVSEENYFFRLSKYSDTIKKLIITNELKIYPESRKNEMLSILEEGLNDVSFSRPKSVLPWGILVPNDETQVMYVWCDALANYITALGYANNDELVSKFWPCDLHIIGKDILRFHAGIWIGMLLSAELPLPKAIGVHGFVTCEGKKMSKSLGNVIDPIELLDTYTVDAVRYFLSREIPTGDDGDFSHERFKIVYSSDLANNFGNLASRVVSMVHKYFDGVVPNIANFEFEEQYNKMFYEYNSHFDNFDIKKAVEEVLMFMNLLNQYVEDSKPWTLAKENQTELLQNVMYNLVEGLKRVTVLMSPYIPDTSLKLAEILQIDLSLNFVDLNSYPMQNVCLSQITPLFPRFE